MFDSDAIRKKFFAHYLALCKQAATKEYAWHQVKKMDDEPSGLFKGIKNHILEKMNATRIKS
ncbi:hypothetical protein UFOVP306_53 [uncultured Caudovirales phage]|uniref:Uncharacterized protein n=1 Tax=uncultured Caudovirales phage TaxID=2100421 RepID=A0A6J5LU90_9CAUD|nr:hypothetical protein UFOVP306_53 [uncultured Caudovirales phage]